MSKLLTKKHFLGVAASTLVSVFLVAGFVFAAITFDDNISIGSGTPGLTLNGDDVYVNGTLEVNDTGRFDGNVILGDAVGDTITVTGTPTFSATSTFNLGGSGGSLVMNDSTRILVGTGLDFTIVHDGTNTTLTSATGDLIIDNTNTAGTTTIRLGTDTAATAFRVTNNTGTGNFFRVLGTGVVAIDGELTVIGNAGADGNVADADNDLLVVGVLEVDGEIEVDGTLDVDGTSDFSATTTFSAGGSAGSLVMNDSTRILVGTGLDFTIVHDGTNTVLTSATGDLIIDNTNANGTTTIRLGSDSISSAFEVRGNDNASDFRVDGAGAVTIPGNIVLGASGTAMTRVLSELTSSIDLAATATTSPCSTGTDAVTNSATGDTVIVNPSTDDAAWDNGTLTAFVESAGTVKITYCVGNTDNGVQDPANMTYRLTIFQF